MKLLQDYNANRKNIKSAIVLFLFRLSNYFATKNKFYRIVGLPIRVFYKIIVEWIMCIEIPERTIIGNNLKLFHGQGLVLHPLVIIGNNVTLRHNTTIGKSTDTSGCPVIGNHVDIGSNSVIIGSINIGNSVTIGAGSIVINNIPDNAVVVGSPARIIRINKEINE